MSIFDKLPPVSQDERVCNPIVEGSVQIRHDLEPTERRELGELKAVNLDHLAADGTVVPETGMRFNEGKLRYDLLPPDAIEVLVTILTKGAKKYAPRNWEKGFSWSECNASLMRHQQAWMKGEDRDPESGELHMGHVMWNAMAITAFQLRGIGIDDRSKLI